MRRTGTMLVGLGTFLSVGVSAYATSVDFTFGTQTINGTMITGLSDGATTAQINTYMDEVLAASGCSGCTASILVSGSAIGAAVDTKYNGEGNVVGPGGASLTLGTASSTTPATSNSSETPGSATNAFLSNTWDQNGTTSATTVSNQITIQFSGITGGLTALSFAYEIFPDGSCTSLTAGNCGASHADTPSGYADQPDLELEAGKNSSGTDAAVDAFGSSGTGIQYGVTPSATNAGGDGTSTKEGSTTIAAPQYIGTWSGSLTGANAGATELDFVDWPATIGIDDVTISYSSSSPVPEPASIALLGTLVVLLTRKLRKV